MKPSIILFLCALVIISCQSNAKDNNPAASCIVSESLAIAKIPIISQGDYKFYKKSTPENVMEYGCEIILNEYGFGFKLFKGPGYKERQGDFSRLISGGQSDIWKFEGKYFSILEGQGISTSYSAPFIVLKLENKSTIDLLFKEHPVTCAYSIVGFEANKYDGTINIEYQKF